MNRAAYLLFESVLTSLVIGCTPAHFAAPQPPSAAENEASILVYRSWAFNAGGASVIFGADGTDYLKLGTDEYAEMEVQPTTYQFFVRTNQADKPFVLEASLDAGSHTCFRAFPNPKNLLKALSLGVANYFGNTFMITETDCPGRDQLAAYRKVEPRRDEK